MAQEPWIKNNIIHGIDEKLYNLHYNRNAGIRPRAFIVNTKDIHAMQLPQLCTGDICTIKIQLTTGGINEEVILCSVYMPYEQNDCIPVNEVRKAIEYSENSGIPIIICADSNAHHTIWGSTDTNKRGERLVEFLATTQLDIINTASSQHS